MVEDGDSKSRMVFVATMQEANLPSVVSASRRQLSAAWVDTWSDYVAKSDVVTALFDEKVKNACNARQTVRT